MVIEGHILRFKKLTQLAHIPARGSERAAGLDLMSAYEVTVPARGRALCKTDLQIILPPGCYGRIAPRSGLAVKHGINCGAGVVDEDYRGNVGILLFNHTDSDFAVMPGDRIAQLICEQIFYPAVVEVPDDKTLSPTKRGENGFGSTGVSARLG